MPSPDASVGRIQSAAEIFRPHAEMGGPCDSQGSRVVLLTQDWVRGLHTAVIQSFGDAAQDILYRTGFEWTLREMTGLNRRLLSQFGVQSELWQMDPKFVLESWWLPMAEHGWGTCSFDCSALARSLAHIHVVESAVAEAFGRADDPVCHLYAGMFAGALSFIERAERHAVEIECRSQGAASCHFIVGPGAEIDAAETLRQQRVPPDEISRRMR